MSFGRFGRARTLAPDYLFSVTCARSGVPLLLIAPPSGGKSTVIFAVEKWLSQHGEAVQRVSRLGLRGLQQLGEWFEGSSQATLVNEDYATLGGSSYMVEKMGEIIGALSYSGSYQDQGMKLDLRMRRLGFVSGVQPLWIKTMMTNPVFSTHIREKFIRYYMLPYQPTHDIEDLEAIEIMVNTLKDENPRNDGRIPQDFILALSLQVGMTRARRFAPMIANQLSRLIPYDMVHKALNFYAVRLGFEHDFVEREMSEMGFEVRTKWTGYHAFYWALRKGKVTREDYMSLLGVTSVRSVERAVEKALQAGWLMASWNDAHRVFTPSESMIKRCGWK